jgi:hypothetical protein
VLILEAEQGLAIKWYVDASFAVHPDMQSHTGATMTLGKGAVYSISTKQKINTKSSMEAELVGVNDAMPLVMWTQNFLQGQGYCMMFKTMSYIKTIRVISCWRTMVVHQVEDTHGTSIFDIFCD